MVNLYKPNDILLYKSSTGPRIIYVIQENKSDGCDYLDGVGNVGYEYDCVEVTLTTCQKLSRIRLQSLNSLGLITMLYNKEVEDTEIMNLTDIYPEYFI